MIVMRRLPVGWCARQSKTLVGGVCRAMSSGDSEVLLDSVGNKGVITLNRPKALNALNLTMVRKITAALRDWESSKSLVIIKGAGEKAFCAGGDVRAVTEAGLRGDKLGEDFFKEEFTLNSLIGTYHIPYVSFIDKITMGGGVGLSVHGAYRVATERTLVAMPESAIGFICDVGGSYFLPRLGGKLGLFLGLTGHRLKGSDVLKAGIATHYVESSQLDDLERSLLEKGNTVRDIEKILGEFSQRDVAEFSLLPHLKQINHCFSAPTVEDIIMRLKEEGSEWSLGMLQVLQKVSPTSLKLIKRTLEEGATKSLQDCLINEFRVACHCLKGHDFFEGVRALLIDKDKPKWKPASLEEVTDDFVASFFAPLPPDQELVL
ncbi:3-hydroxyisobutyryl-CoA hydrolase, mitochondrial [Bacillus rossius redtenbacheri]|uniref:3-hydroxyisobutyryl-CoA hydrolase, mitochondrial n=1 Tax=Bacillus rossius redtenbacheri TaxID=93214 RepID=UPI002FDE24A5